MKVKLSHVINSVEIIKKLTKAELPVKIAFRFISTTKQIDEKLKAYEEARIELIKKYGTEKEEGAFKIDDENIPKFNEEYFSLLEEEVEIDVQKIHIDAFPDSLKVTPSELVQLEWLIDM